MFDAIVVFILMQFSRSISTSHKHNNSFLSYIALLLFLSANSLPEKKLLYLAKYNLSLRKYGLF